MSFRFLHLADVHLETCFGGKQRTRERLREATLKAFDRALEFAREEKLHAVLVAGDLFDDAILSPRVQWRIVDQVRSLASSGTTSSSVPPTTDMHAPLPPPSCEVATATAA